MACKNTIELGPDDYFTIFEEGGMQTETIAVTPELAKAWLQRNVINRPLVERHVEDLVWEVKNGQWKLTHQGIAFNRRGELIDGQHRLTAIARAGGTMHVRVTFNVDGSYDSPIDTGLRVRRAHDILHLTPRDVAICNALLALERSSHHQGSASKIGQVHAQHRAGIDWVKQTFPFQRGITASLLAAHAFAHPAAPRDVASFAKQFLSHTGSSSNEPAIVLHRYLERSSRTALRGRELSFAALRCLEAHCQGQTLARLSATESGLTYFAELRAAKGI
ncbi:MAG: hypothetical protein ACLQVI_11385 [Polyangiaceae bacterium]